jgi:hypothetical protein
MKWGRVKARSKFHKSKTIEIWHDEYKYNDSVYLNTVYISRRDSIINNVLGKIRVETKACSRINEIKYLMIK